MSKEIQKVFDSCSSEMNAFRKEFDILIRSDVQFLNTVINYLFKHRGKQLRPLFVILSSGLCGKICDETYKAAAMIELIHTATLIHDDVVDEADQRRGIFTVNALWKNKVAVLVGDYLLAKGLLTALDNNYFSLLKLISEATRKMSEGELLQLEKSRGMKTDETTYFEIIEKKTAVLFAVSFSGGGLAAGANEETLNTLYQVGLNAGMAFQISDDLLDFSISSGKQHFSDLKEKKLTLPVIHSMELSSPLERRKYSKMIRDFKTHRTTQNEITDWIKQKGGFDYARIKMEDYINKSITLLAAFSDNSYKEHCINTIKFISQRHY